MVITVAFKKVEMLVVVLTTAWPAVRAEPLSIASAVKVEPGE